MKKAKATIAQTAETSDKPVIGSIEVKKIVRETVSITAGDRLNSFGSIIDDMIADAATSGEEIQDISVSITEEHWQEIAKAIQLAEQQRLARYNENDVYHN